MQKTAYEICISDWSSDVCSPDQQLADGDGRAFRLRPGALESLRLRELEGAGERIGKELGKRFAPAKMGEAIEGVIARRVDLESCPHALVERSRDFTLVPWRDVLDRNIDRKSTRLNSSH